MLIPHPPEAGISFARVNAYQVAETDFDPLGLRPLPLSRGRAGASIGFRGCVEHGARSEQLPAWKGGVARRVGVVFFICFFIKNKYAATCWAMTFARGTELHPPCKEPVPIFFREGVRRAGDFFNEDLYTISKNRKLLSFSVC